MTFDIGQNLTFLGLIFLFLKFILPIIFLLVLGIALIWLIRYIYSQRSPNYDFWTRSSEWAIVLVCAALILFLVIFT